MKQQPKSRLESIDCLRGMAALAVVFHHAIRYGEDQPQNKVFRAIYNIVDLGYLGVPLFFVLSGFCIHLKWAEQQAKGSQREWDFRGFWKRRFLRLYPPYFVALCLCMIMVLVAYLRQMPVPLVTCYPEPRLHWIAIDFLAHVFMMHGFHPILDRAGGNPPFWTLAREEYFYLLYFVLLIWRRALGVIPTLGLVFALGLAFPFLVGLALSSDSNWWGLVHSSAIVLWVQWCLGMVAVESYCGIIRLPNWCSDPWMVPVWGISAILGGATVPALTPFLWGMTFFTLLNACVCREKTNLWKRGVFKAWLARVGLFSYSLYLVHNPARYLVKRLLGPLAETSNSIIYLLNASLMALVGYYSGKLFFKLVEERFLLRNASRAVPALGALKAEDTELLDV